jgi:hypothetical protein
MTFANRFSELGYRSELAAMIFEEGPASSVRMQ